MLSCDYRRNTVDYCQCMQQRLGPGANASPRYVLSQDGSKHRAQSTSLSYLCYVLLSAISHVCHVSISAIGHESILSLLFIAFIAVWYAW